MHESCPCPPHSSSGAFGCRTAGGVKRLVDECISSRMLALANSGAIGCCVPWGARGPTKCQGESPQSTIRDRGLRLAPNLARG